MAFSSFVGYANLMAVAVTSGGGTNDKVVDSSNGDIELRHLGTGAAQSSDAPLLNIILPPDYKSIQTIAFDTRRDGTTNVFDGFVDHDGVTDPGADTIDIKPTANQTFEAKTLSPSATYLPDDLLLLDNLSTLDDTEEHKIRRFDIQVRV